MKKLLAIFVVMLFLTTSCSTLATPKTKSEKIGYLNGLVAAFAHTTQQFLDTGKISVKVAKTIQANIHIAAQELDLAQNSTNATRINDAIQGASILLNGVKTQLEAANGTKGN